MFILLELDHFKRKEKLTYEKDKHQLLLNMTKEEKEKFKTNADSNFMSLSQYIRWCVHEMIKKNK